ncbi:MAG TPA: SusC/RagA family TonB-linked outer membrane protein [Porphyromonadaceae bacterium]|nr:SusC/RagA family TonB-linked outer membrane protein [Porphyromonadaceae bacterium]HBX21327.1 SusC/RagA family TonB-linked outer membrane protein [Porphyromonadaceae bacterium]HCM21986.1 SusC/RagA family TonB-linked outer membrane protein [Porphyromonadaceae bacterium]
MDCFFMIRFRMNKIIGVLLILCFYLCTAFSQHHQADAEWIRGIVLSATDKLPLKGATVKNKRNHINTLTDINGKFDIQGKKGDRLEISCIGFHKKEIEIGKTSDVIIYLDEKVEELKEFVVTGNKNINDIDMRKLAGSIVTIDMSKLSVQPEMDLLRLLQGQVPGLMVTTSGELGAKPVIRIRGESSFSTSANEPLYVLDGVVISSEAFLALNPEDFEKIKVLKDAAASALYGIKAANGVIEISSKRGFVGKPYVTFTGRSGVTLKGPRGVQMMDSKEKLELERLIQNESTPGYRYSADYYRKSYADDPRLDDLIANGQLYLDSLRNINTDWFNELIKVNIIQNYSLGIRGGTEKNTYFYSLSYGKQGGRIEGNDIQRFTARMNQDYVLSPRFNVSLNIGGGYSETNTPNGSSYDPATLIYDLNPYEQKNNPQTGEPAVLWSYPNRTFYDLMNEYSRKSNAKRIEFSSVFHWMPVEGLDVSGVVGTDFLLNEKKSIVPPTAYSQKDYKNDAKGELTQDKASELNLTSNFRANYNKRIDEHDITLGMNTDYYYTAHDGIGLHGYGLPSKINTAAGINQGLTDSRRVRTNSRTEKNAQFGFGMAFGYSFRDTYDIYGSYKRDASSLLPSNKRWNTAWSAGAGWRFGNYAFMKTNKVVTDINLRFSYGYTAGMAGIDVAGTVPVFAYQTEVYASGRIFSLKSLYNKDLKPQQIQNTNAGAELTFLNRWNVSADIYKNTTGDAILSMPIPPSNGYDQMYRNIGVLENSGLEIKISGDIVRLNRFTWNTALSLSHNKNKVVKLYGGDKLFSNNDIQLPDMEVGKPVGTIYGLRSLGIHPIDGLPRFLSGEGKEIDYTYYSSLRSNDFVQLGYNTPPYMGFFNSSVTYGALSLSFNFYFSFGGISTYSRRYVRDRDEIQYNAVKGQTSDMWFKPGDENKMYHTPNIPGSAYSILDLPSSETVFKTDFIRLNNVALNYRLPASLLAKTGFVRYMQINVQAQNLWSARKETDKASLINVVQPVIVCGLNVTF